MKVFREEVLRDGADEPTLNMLELWHELCASAVGAKIEVGFASRKEHQSFQHFEGEFNTALPMLVDDRPFLVLLFDQLWSDEDVITTHELGHWVLKLQGFRMIQFAPKPNSDTELSFNSMCHHPALYSLQRTLGHEPQKEIDSRARNDLKLLNKPFDGSSLFGMFLIADDVLNCSSRLADKLSKALKRASPNAAEVVDDIVQISAVHNPADLSSNPNFIEAVMKRLHFSSQWKSLDEIKFLRKIAGTL